MRSRACAFAIAIFAAASAFSQSNVQLDLQTGFRGAYQAPAWVPFRLLVQNVGRAISGTLTIESGISSSLDTSNESFARSYAIDLAQGARKEFSFAMPVPEGFSPLRFRIRSGDRTVHEESIELPRPLLDGELVVVLSRRPALDYIIDGESRRRAVPAYPLPEQLPETWIAYNGVRALVIHDADLNRLSTGQVEAIGRWARAGGTVAVVGGAGFDRQSADMLSAWLPYSYGGMAPIPGTSILATRFEPRGPADMLFERDGVRAQAAPLGRGRVAAVNVGPADLAELGVERRELWSQLLGTAPDGNDRVTVPISAGREPLEQPLLSSFIEASHYSFPRQWILLIGAVLYGVGTWLLLRYARRFALLLPIVTLAFVLAAYRTIAPPPFAAAQLEQFLGTSETRVGSLRNDVILFGTTDRDYEVRLDPRSSVIPLEGERTETAADGILSGRVQPWQVSNHLGSGLEDAPILIEQADERGALRLFNNSTVALTGAAVLSGDRAWSSGPLAADSEITVRHDDSRLLDRIGPESELQLSAEQRGVLSRIQALRGSSYPDAPLFVGWMERLMAPARVEPDPDWVGEMSIVIITLPQEWFGDE